MASFFVIKKGDFFDIRLQDISEENILRSWVLQQAPSNEIGLIRLAKPTADHPLSYEEFHGITPVQQQRTGIATLWDQGILDWLDCSDTLHFRLQGQKLHGTFLLCPFKKYFLFGRVN